MKLIVGLGNPGKEYENTRHNIGFMVIDNFAKENNQVIDKKKFNGLFTKFEYNRELVILLKPLSYMNLSGEVIKKYVKWYKIAVEDILIISDDLDQDSCKIKLKEKGTSGGHNGLKSIEENLKTTEYKRLKIGISNDKMVDTKDYVLGKLSDEEQIEFKKLLNKTNKILEDFIKIDFGRVMNKYN